MNMLEKITARKRIRVQEKKKIRPQKELEGMAANGPSPLDFPWAISLPGISLIAEFKRASPSRGLIKASASPGSVAQAYQEGGASAISVLTEEDFFLGSVMDLTEVRRVVDVPLLAKDFFLTPYQIYEARLCGADAILLIAAILTDKELLDLYSLAESLGLAVLLEVHNGEEIGRVSRLFAPKIMGINNRDLSTFVVDMKTTLSLIDLIPSGSLVVSESGIKRREEVLLLQEKGVDAVLVGEALMTGRSIKSLLGRDRG